MVRVEDDSAIIRLVTGSTSTDSKVPLDTHAFFAPSSVVVSRVLQDKIC